jgi:hypothetical protein
VFWPICCASEGRAAASTNKKRVMGARIIKTLR